MLCWSGRCDLPECASHRRELRSKGVESLPARRPFLLGENPSAIRQSPPERGELCLAILVMLQTRDLCEEVVAGRAIDLPIAGKEFVAREYLFDHDVGRSGRSAGWPCLLEFR